MLPYFLREKGAIVKKRRKWSAEKFEENLISFFQGRSLIVQGAVFPHRIILERPAPSVDLSSGVPF